MMVEFAGSGEGGWELLRSGRFDVRGSARERAAKARLAPCPSPWPAKRRPMLRRPPLLRPTPRLAHGSHLSRVLACAQIAFVDIHLPGVSGLDLSWCYLQLCTNGDAVIGGSSKPADGWGAAEPGGSSRAGMPQRQTIIIACTEDTRANQEQLQSYGIHDVLRKPVRAEPSLPADTMAPAALPRAAVSAAPVWAPSPPP